jgi:hypothetical protein
MNNSSPTRWYLLGTALLVMGILCAAARYPQGFDWHYTVISALASRKHNPGGAAWFAAAIATAMACLWPAVTQLTREARVPYWVMISLRVGVVCGVFVGVERLVFYHFSNEVKKGHEVIALIAFLSFYAGLIGLYVNRALHRRGFLLPAILVVVPLLGVGFRELSLYVLQRDVGWADYDWKGTGLPLWLSFAFWQWAAAGLLWISIGHLLLTQGSDKR